MQRYSRFLNFFLQMLPPGLTPYAVPVRLPGLQQKTVGLDHRSRQKDFHLVLFVTDSEYES